MDLSGWYLFSEKGKEIFVFPQGAALDPGASCTVTTLTSESSGDYQWPDTRVWHEDKPDAARSMTVTVSLSAGWNSFSYACRPGRRCPFAWPGRTVSCPSHCLRKTDRSLLCLRSVSLCVWHKSERLLYVHRWWRGKRNTPQASREVLYHTRICHGDLLHCAGQTFVIAHLDGAQ